MPAARRRRAASAQHLLASPLLLWGIAAAFALAHIISLLTVSQFHDGRAFLGAGHAFLSDPSNTYSRSLQAFAVPGQERAISGQNEPPAALLLSAPFALLPVELGVRLFALGGIICMVTAVALLDRHLALHGRVRAMVWLMAAAFTPVFAAAETAQLDGYLLLLGVIGMLTLQRRPVLAGLLAGVGGAIKIYPAGLWLTVGPRRVLRVMAATAVGGLVASAIAVARLGIDTTLSYVHGVLLPALGITNPDCAQNSVSNLWSRLVGGEAFPSLSAGAIAWHSLPWSAPLAAAILTRVTQVLVVALAVDGARRSGWNPPYAAALAFALGSLLPGEAYPYQFLPLLPLLVLTSVAAVRAHRLLPLGAVVLALVCFLPGPCDLIFPSLWTLAALTIFGAGVMSAPLFRVRETVAP
jgi:hypothetical protein